MTVACAWEVRCSSSLLRLGFLTGFWIPGTITWVTNESINPRESNHFLRSHTVSRRADSKPTSDSEVQSLSSLSGVPLAPPVVLGTYFSTLDKTVGVKVSHWILGARGLPEPCIFHSPFPTSSSLLEWLLGVPAQWNGLKGRASEWTMALLIDMRGNAGVRPNMGESG